MLVRKRMNNKIINILLNRTSDIHRKSLFPLSGVVGILLHVNMQSIA